MTQPGQIGKKHSLAAAYAEAVDAAAQAVDAAKEAAAAAEISYAAYAAIERKWQLNRLSLIIWRLRHDSILQNAE